MPPTYLRTLTPQRAAELPYLLRWCSYVTKSHHRYCRHCTRNQIFCLPITRYELPATRTRFHRRDARLTAMRSLRYRLAVRRFASTYVAPVESGVSATAGVFLSKVSESTSLPPEIVCYQRGELPAGGTASCKSQPSECSWTLAHSLPSAPFSP